MPSLVRTRKGSPPWSAREVGRAVARIADNIRAAVRAVDGALRAEFDETEAALADMLRAQPNVQLPEHPYCCKDPHVRIRHEHGLLCIEVPQVACALRDMAQRLRLPTAPKLCVPAFNLRKHRTRAPRIIDVEASRAAIVCEARARGWATFEDGSAPVQSVALALTGSHSRVGNALLALSTIAETPGRTAVRELADAVYFAGSRLRAIADRVAGAAGPRRRLAPGVRSIIESFRDFEASLRELDARIRKVCLFDPTPRGSHSRDIAYQEVVCELADAEFDVEEVARLVVPTSKRDRRLWEKRVGDHIREGDLRD